MRIKTYRLLGILMVLVAVVTWVGSAVGIAFVWIKVPSVTSTVGDKLSSIDDMLVSTQNMVDKVDDMVTKINNKLTLIIELSNKVSPFMDKSTNAIKEVDSLTKDDLPGLVFDVQVSLKSMETTTRLVDDILDVITSLPLVSTRYKPEVPLSEAVNKVSRNLDKLPAVLSKVENNLYETNKALAPLTEDIEKLTGSMGEIKDDFNMIAGTTGKYKKNLKDAQDLVNTLRSRYTSWVIILAGLITLFFCWMSLTQLSNFMSGFAILSKNAIDKSVEDNKLA